MEPEYDESKLTIIPLGAGCEVGRSCVVLKYKNKTVMFDCGVHMAKSGMDSLPYFDKIEPESVDLLLITHFHLDHCGAVPYFLEKTRFKGRVYMTYPTKAIFPTIIEDSAKVSKNPKGENDENTLYDKNDIKNATNKIRLMHYHQELEYKGIKFTCYNAGHVIGAAMFLVSIDGVRVLYTGDYSREEDRHLQPAEIPNVPIDVLIVESTYGIKEHEPRKDREQRFTNEVRKIVERGGKCLLPVFALGRSQELLLILEEYWQKHKELHNIEIFYRCSLASKCMKFYQTYLNMLSPEVRQRFKKGENPFVFKFIKDQMEISPKPDGPDNDNPQVVMASPGMLQNGLSRTIFESWCHDERNGVIITGYCVENTLAKQILSNPNEITKQDGSKAELRMEVSCISFSAHADYKQTSEFIRIVKPTNVILVHGERQEGSKLQKMLESKFSDIWFHQPDNGQEVYFFFEDKPRDCKFVGELARDIASEMQSFLENAEVPLMDEDEKIIDDALKIMELEIPLENLEEEFERKEQMELMSSEGLDNMELIPEHKGQETVKLSYRAIPVKGVLFACDNSLVMMKNKDIPEYMNVTISHLNQKVMVPFEGGYHMVDFCARSIFSRVEKISVKGKYYVKVLDEIFLSLDEKILSVEWISSARNDIAADHLCTFFSHFSEKNADIFRNQSSEEGAALSRSGLIQLLEMNYKPNIKLFPTPEGQELVQARINDVEVTIELTSQNVTCSDPIIKDRIRYLLQGLSLANCKFY